MAVLPFPPPELVTVPVLLTLVPERVIPPLVALLLLRIRLAAPALVTPPDAVKVPVVSVSVVPLAFAVIAPVMLSVEPALFSVTPVTFEPMPALMSVLPVPVPPLPEFVIIPALLTLAPDRVIPLAMELLFWRIILPVPPTPPDAVNRLEPLALLLISVIPLVLFVVRAPVILSAELELFSVMPVTFEPTPSLMRTLPLEPELVIVPVLLIMPPKWEERVMPLATPL